MTNLKNSLVACVTVACLALCARAQADELKPKQPVFYLGCGTVTGPGKIIQLDRAGKQLGIVELPACPYGLSWNGREVVAALPRAGKIVRIGRTGAVSNLIEVGHPIDVAARGGRVVVSDNVSDVVLMSSGMTGDDQMRTLSTFFRSSSSQNMSVALTGNGQIIVGTGRPSGIYRFGEDDGQKIEEPLLPLDGEVAADQRSNRWAATQPAKLHVFNGNRGVAALPYPEGTGTYRGGIVAFGSDGALYATLKTKTGIELFEVDVMASTFHSLFQWQGERLVDFAVGSRLDWLEKE